MGTNDINAELDVDLSAPDWRSIVGDLTLKLHAGLNDVSEQLKKLRMEQKRMAASPNYVTLTQASTGATPTNILEFGGPQPGREWVLLWVCGFADPLAANAALPTFYFGQRIAGSAAGMLQVSMARYQPAAFPFSNSFSGQVLKLKWGEKLFCGLTAIPASSNLVVTVAFNDQPAEPDAMLVTEV